MKRKLYVFSTLLCTAFTFAGPLSQKADSARKMRVEKPPSAGFVVSKMTYAKAQTTNPSVRSFIEGHEYYIRNTAGVYASPNRKQNTRIVYNTNGFEIEPRKKDAGNWRLQLALAGINKGGRNLSRSAKPFLRTKGNTLWIQHPDYTVEYINAKNGTRQNFLVAKRPAGNGALKVLLQPTGTVAVENVTPVSASFGDASGTKLYYRDLKAWDADGKPLPAKMEREGNLLALVVDDKNATYPVTVDPLATTPGQTLPGQQDDDQMGYSVASAGDINKDGFGDLVVGAITYDNGQTDEGAVFVYYGSVTGLATTPNLILESNAANLRFGYSLAAADFNNDGFSDIAVGVPQYTNGVGEAYEGAVYIYYGAASGPAASPVILEGNKAGARMGTCVAVGDLNGDGLADIASGALGYNNAGALYNGQGGVYVFYGITGGFDTTPVILAAGLQGGVAFGGSTTGVSIGNFNGDGFQDLAVGAEGYDEGVSNQGAVFVYFGSATGVPPAYSKLFTGGQASAGLGSSVSFAGDLNKDGYQDIAAGAPYYTNSQNREGAVFVYFGSASSSINTQILESNTADAYMGYAVAGGGDLDGDGYDDLAAGAYNYQFDPDTRGGVFVFGGSAAGVQTVPILSKQGSDANLNGFAIAFAKNIDGANGLHLAVGMPGYTGGVAANGSVDLYSGEPGTLPVSLGEFNAKLLQNGEVVVTWDTYSEERNAYFDVLRSTDGTGFALLGRQEGQHNATSRNTYRLVDKSPVRGNNFYRLVQYDLDGRSKTLGTRMVQVGIANGTVAVYPNPTVGPVSLDLKSETYAKAELVDLSGRLLATQKPMAGNLLHFSLSGRPNGTYLVKLYGDNGKVISKRVVKK